MPCGSPEGAPVRNCTHGTWVGVIPKCRHFGYLWGGKRGSEAGTIGQGFGSEFSENFGTSFGGFLEVLWAPFGDQFRVRKQGRKMDRKTEGSEAGRDAQDPTDLKSDQVKKHATGPGMDQYVSIYLI